MKVLKLFFIIFILSSSFAIASDLSQHGKDLMKAPFAMRYKFEKDYHKAWTKSIYNERKNFLTNWYQQEATDRKKAQIQAKEEANAKKELQKQKDAQKKRLANIIKADEQKQKQEHREDAQRKKNLDQHEATQRHELQRLESQHN